MTAAPTRPVLRWHGSKWRIAPWVIGHFPPHRVYLEPFGGGASVLLRKVPCESEIYNDLDGDVVNMFRVIREHTDALADALALTPYARDEYASLYEGADDPIEAARRFIARSFIGMSSKGALEKSGFDARVNADGFFSRLRSLTSLPEEVGAVAARMREVCIENVDALDLIRRIDRPDALIYADPPYLSPVRSGKYYRHEMGDAEHLALLDVLEASASMVVLSGYDSPLYADRLSNWHRAELDAWADGGVARTEVLWLNPAATAALKASGRFAAQIEMFEACA